MPLRQGTFAEKDLILISDGSDLRPPSPPLAIGEKVRLIDGVYALTVVDIEGQRVIVAWRDQRGIVQELDLPALLCVRMSGPSESQ